MKRGVGRAVITHDGRVGSRDVLVRDVEWGMRHFMPVDGGIRPRAAFSHGIDGLHGDVVVPFFANRTR